MDQRRLRGILWEDQNCREVKNLGHFGRGFFIGPSEEIRTPDILLPKQARYQLRYTRIFLSI